jgi:hypothetical protein
VHEIPTGFYDSCHVGEQRLDLRNVLKYVRSEDDVELAVAERQMNAVVLADGPDTL